MLESSKLRCCSLEWILVLPIIWSERHGQMLFQNREILSQLDFAYLELFLSRELFLQAQWRSKIPYESHVALRKLLSFHSGILRFIWKWCVQAILCMCRVKKLAGMMWEGTNFLFRYGDDFCVLPFSREIHAWQWFFRILMLNTLCTTRHLEFHQLQVIF